MVFTKKASIVTIYTKSPALQEQVVDGETVVLDMESGLIHQLNPTASEIWHCLDGTRKIEAIAEHIANMYGVDPELVLADVSNALEEMRKNRLIQPI